MELHISEKEYRERPEPSQSLIKDILDKTPKKFDWYKKNPKPPTKDMEFGTLLHCKLLEPEKFDQKYAVFRPDESLFYKPDGSMYTNVKATKGYKEAFKSFVEENEDKIIVDPTVMDNIEKATMSARSYSPILNFIKKKDIHTELAIVNELEGVPFKGMFDLIDLGRDVIIDIKKTSESLDDDTLHRHIMKWNFPIQAAAYLDLARNEYGREFTFVFLMINDTDPFECRYVSMNDELTPEMLAWGRENIRIGLEKWKMWKNNDPEFYRMRQFVCDDLPPWFSGKYKQMNEDY